MTDENSDTPAPEEVPADSVSPVRSPGAMIRAARERTRISVEELASQIKLARPTLEALERDDFNQLLEPVYVHGYYRKCAKVLGLSDTELIEAYRSRAMPKQPSAPSKLRLASGTELGSDNRLPVPMAIAAAVLASFFCVFVWNMLKTSQDIPPPVALPVPPPVMPLPEPVTDPLAVPADPAAAAVVDPATGTAIPPASATATPAAPAAPASPTSPAPLPAPAAASPAAATAAPAAPAVVSNAPDGSAVLNFSNTSWVRVDDSTGRTMLNGLLHAGDRQLLKGKLPFTVFLGNAPAVAVEFEGRPVDFAGLVTDNLTARFNLPMAPKP